MFKQSDVLIQLGVVEKGLK